MMQKNSVPLFFSWLLYEKPGFQGRIIALEEGPTEQIVNVWADEEGSPETLNQTDECIPTAPMVIGSLRLAVQVSLFLVYIIFQVASCFLTVTVAIFSCYVFFFPNKVSEGFINRVWN